MKLIATFDSKIDGQSPRMHAPKPYKPQRWYVKIWGKGNYVLSGESTIQIRPKAPCTYGELILLIAKAIEEIREDVSGAAHMKFWIYQAR